MLDANNKNKDEWNENDWKAKDYIETFKDGKKPWEEGLTIARFEWKNALPVKSPHRYGTLVGIVDEKNESKPRLVIKLFGKRFTLI